MLEISADEASRLAGRPDAIRNLRRKVKSRGAGSMRADTLAALAEALQTTTEELQRDDQQPARVLPTPGLRQYLLAQRALIDEQIAALDAAEFTAKSERKRKIR